MSYILSIGLIFTQISFILYFQKYFKDTKKIKERLIYLEFKDILRDKKEKLPYFDLGGSIK